jgi:hypothetical protein
LNPTIIRQGHLSEKIVIVDGQPGCGKTMLSPIISAMGRVELINYAFEIEFICRLLHMQKIEKDAAVAMVRMLTDHKLYQTMMGRETNFRYSDISSAFKDSNSWRYFMRIFQKGDMVIPEKIKKQRPILNLTTHDLLSYSVPIFEGLGERVAFIEVVRHPLYMLIQQTLNFEKLLSDPRDIQIYIEHGEHQLPYFAYNWENLFTSSNAVEKSIYTMQRCIELSENIKKKLKEKFGKQILTIPFEKFVLDPLSFMKIIENMLDTKMTSTTKREMKKQKVPRKTVSAGISLSIYKRCGWEPPDKTLTERQELDKRRDYALFQGASKDAMKALDEICQNYEENIWSP